MTPSQPEAPTRRWLWVALAFVAGMLIMGAIAFLLTNIQTRKAEAIEFPLKTVKIEANELDPAVWGQNFPRQYDSFKKTEIDGNKTPYGGSEPYDKLEAYPMLKRVWAGYAFSVDFNEERGHYYALIDQKETKRQEVVKQPAACANCHAAESPQLIAEMGWENFNKTPYKEMQDRLHLGTSCADCHDPDTMELRITRPAFKFAMEEIGVDLSRATRQEMRTYVCAQCHVEYYFEGENKLLTFPWDKGFQIDNIIDYYDEYGFKDWTHKETGAPMLKAQHPEFETFTTSLHSRAGVACADCHMPYIRIGARKISDHHVRSPLLSISNACQTCHRVPEEELKARAETIQQRTFELRSMVLDGFVEYVADLKAARGSLSPAQLEQCQLAQRRAGFLLDFVEAENSMGFHAPEEAARNLTLSLNYIREGQRLLRTGAAEG